MDGRPEVIVQNCDESLARLGIETIDLYYLHRRDKKVPIEDSVGALSGLVKAGKVKTIGLSEVSAATIRAAHAVHPIAAVQTEYSLWTRNPEVAVLDTCRELGITVVAFSPLARGFLTGRLRGIDHLPPKDIRHNMPRFQSEHLPATWRCSTGWPRSPSSTAAPWARWRWRGCWRAASTSSRFPARRNLEHLAENADAVDVHLSEETMAALDALINPRTVSGPRYSEAVQRDIDTEEIPS